MLRGPTHGTSCTRHSRWRAGWACRWRAPRPARRRPTDAIAPDCPYAWRDRGWCCRRAGCSSCSFQLLSGGFPPARFCDVFGAGLLTPNARAPKARPTKGVAMKVNIEMDMTPEEARAFMGLPDIKPMQNKMMEEMQ